MYGKMYSCGLLPYLKSYLVPLTTSTVNYLNDKTQLILRLTMEGVKSQAETPEEV